MSRFYQIICLLALTLFANADLSAAPARSKAKKKVDPMEKFTSAQTAFDNYNFAETLSLLEEYRTAIGKTDRKTTYPDDSDLRRRSEIGASMLDRVEQVVIIDSINVNRHNFFSAYSLSPAAGSLIQAESVSPEFSAANATPVYVTEKGSTMIYSTSLPGDSLLRLHTTSQLVDGSWEKPYNIGSPMINDANTAFPFLMPDGITLYFASDNDESLGGYDIFMSRREGKDYLKPQNIGMPYNSPADDYMLAIDEMTGLGWWATDRNQIADSVTIYIFAPAELRINYPADTPDLASKARITSIAATQPEGKDFSHLTHYLNTKATHTKSEELEFQFAMPDGSVCTSLSSLRNPDAVAAMRRYLSVSDEIATIKSDLSALRSRYAAGDKSVSQEILTLESELTKQLRLLRDISNNVIKAEFPNL